MQLEKKNQGNESNFGELKRRMTFMYNEGEPELDTLN